MEQINVFLLLNGIHKLKFMIVINRVEYNICILELNNSKMVLVNKQRLIMILEINFIQNFKYIFLKK